MELRREAFQTCNLDCGDELREDRTERKQEMGVGTRREKRGKHSESREEPLLTELEMGSGDGSIRLVHVD